MPSMIEINEPARPAVERRDFLKLMGAATAMATLACTRNHLPAESILSVREEDIAHPLDEARHYATGFPMPGFEEAVVVKTQAGRPIRIDGNPEASANLKAASIFAQASVLDLYSPDRLKFVLKQNGKGAVRSTWADFLRGFHAEKKTSSKNQAWIFESLSSPLLRQQLQEMQKANPRVQIFEHCPFSNRNEASGIFDVTGNFQVATPLFQNADLVISFDRDFLSQDVQALENARAYMNKRIGHETNIDPRTNIGLSTISASSAPSPIRLVMLESNLSITGSKADVRHAISRGEIETLLEEIHHALASKSPGAHLLPSASPERAVQFESPTRVAPHPLTESLASQLRAHKSPLVMIGRDLSPRAHALGLMINQQLGQISKTVSYRQRPKPFPSLRDLLQQSAPMDEMIFVGGNPLHNIPDDADFKKKISNCKLSAHLSLFENETSKACQWQLPLSHFLETWSDLEIPSGEHLILQPTIERSATPQISGDSRSVHEFLEMIEKPLSLNDAGFSILRKAFAHLDGKSWHAALARGIVTTTNLTQDSKPQARDKSPGHMPSTFTRSATSDAGMELIITPDPTIWDGWGSENPWLQELPKPPTSLVWDNALLISEELATEKTLKTGDLVKIGANKTHLEIAVCVVPGLAPRTLVLSEGYGRTVGGAVSTNSDHASSSHHEKRERLSPSSGFRAATLMSWQSPLHCLVESFEKIEGHFELALTQTHHELNQPGLFAKRKGETADELGMGHFKNPSSLVKTETPQWGMTIDLESCIGCAACVISCQSENNIPVVGKNQVLAGREMHWIRIDRYESKGRHSQPLPITCMHCETAPCEYVCPVAATSHSSEGLNQMVYNRCVGTRYCSNNCPYKVRRFNFYKFADGRIPGEDLNLQTSSVYQRNPEVSVRSRGVMEKCTYCVQRIERAKIKDEVAQLETACQQACPTRAITFGNLKDQMSDVYRMKISRRNFGLLTELGTRPRTTYLAQLPPNAGAN